MYELILVPIKRKLWITAEKNSDILWNFAILNVNLVFCKDENFGQE